MIYSLLIKGWRYRLDTAAWLSDLLRPIPIFTQANVSESLPWNWKPAGSLTFEVHREWRRSNVREQPGIITPSRQSENRGFTARIHLGGRQTS